MPAFSSVFLVIALVLAVVIGPQTRPWTWGAAMLALGVSVAAALPVFWKKGRLTADFGLLAFAALVAGWFAWRACNSPVAELGQADLILLVGAIGAFVSIRAIEGNEPAETILIWGIALLLLANVVVVGIQMANPEFTPIFNSRTETFPSGFYAHYNEAANYLIASSLLVAAGAIFGRQGMASRIWWGVIAISGLVAVYFTGSRGGILGAAVGCGVFTCAALAVGKRSDARWFAPALIAVPVLGLGIAMFLLYGWKNSQEARNAGVGIEQVLDSNYRLSFLGIAMSCIGLHPMAGGGSRSFSWECFQFFDVAVQGGAITLKPEQVHNELLQAATDYGLIGAGLLAVLLCSLAVIATVRILFRENSRQNCICDAWLVGGTAALAGMFVQSCFSFVFHLFPGVLLLGICLGQMARPVSVRSNAPAAIGSRIALTMAVIACTVVLLPFGWNGSRVTKVLWSTFFSDLPATSAEIISDALTDAIGIWPQSSFYKERASAFQAAATEAEPKIEKLLDEAIDNYHHAWRLHPLDAGIAINLANLLSHRQQDMEAERAYQRAIQLQGGGEAAFQSHFSFASHLMRKSYRQLSLNNPSVPLKAMEDAARHMEQSVKEMGWASPNIYDSRVTVHESLGAVREANGDYQGAMEAYNFACTLTGGSRVHYRVGLLLGRKAASTWADRRPAEGLAYFIEAKRRLEMATELPKDVTPSQRLEYLAYLEKSLTFLRGAKIEPLPVK